jgi:hypothetical protein
MSDMSIVLDTDHLPASTNFPLSHLKILSHLVDSSRLVGYLECIQASGTVASLAIEQPSRVNTFAF